MIRKGFQILLSICAFGLALEPSSVLACAACFGQSDSALAQGMNWGIFSLLAVITSVLGVIASFFIYLAKRSAMAADSDLSEALVDVSKKV